MKYNTFFLVILFIQIIAIGIVAPIQGFPEDKTFLSPMGVVNISTDIPDSPSEMIAFRTISGVNDIAYFTAPELVKVRSNVTTEGEAPQVAQIALLPYGGLPQGAKLGRVNTEYIERIDTVTDNITAKYPVLTNVVYDRYIENFPVIGPGGITYIDLGEDGELLYLNKVWRSVVPEGNFSVIPVSIAIEKLQNGEILNQKKEPYNVNITKIRLGYYEKGRNESQEYLEPAWLFKGITDTGEDIQYYVYARRFANFTANPIELTRWQAVQFNDTSDASPVRWYWEFGDGTNSTEQNPAHTYQKGGNYTVNLTVRNDLGSDTISRLEYIHVNYNDVVPVANFTTNCTGEGLSPFAVAFTDISSGVNITRFWDFGDGTNSTEENPVHVFNAQYGHEGDGYETTLTIVDDVGRSSSHSEFFAIMQNQTPDFAIIPDGGPAPLNVTFTDLSVEMPPDIFYKFWDLGDGTTTYYDGSADPPKSFTHEYTLEGNYSVSLTNYACWHGECPLTTTKYVLVKNDTTMVSSFSANITSGKVPLAVSFTDVSKGSPTVWFWDFGDATNSTDQNPVHIYTGAGTYSVSLNVSNTYGSNTSVKVDYIHALSTEPPVADFIANRTTGYSPLPVAFTDMSANAPANWSWDFGDGKISTDQDPEHTYPAPGNYTVKLTVMNDEGRDMKTRIEYIHIPAELPPVIDDPKLPPVSRFTANTTSGKAPLAIAFTDTSLFYPDHWTWSFGDGATSADQNPGYVYTQPGNYTVNLTAGNAYGENETIKTDYITVLPLTPPVAGFTANTTSGKIPLAVAFTDISSNNPTSWSWAFGDGGSSSEEDPVHVYATAGQFTVMLQVTNEDGSNTTIKEQYVTAGVPVPPAAEFTANRTYGTAPLAVGFTDQSSGSPVTWHWIFGDGASSDEQNPSHVYADTGTYTVSLQVSNPDGSNTTEKQDYVTVTSALQPPVANFTGRPTRGKAPLTVRFNDTSTRSPTAWKWDFGDGTSSTEQHPVHIYAAAGKYTVSLTATNSGGSNTSTRKDYITVRGCNKPPVADFYGTPISGNAPLSVKFTDTSTGSPTSWYWDFGDETNAAGQNPIHGYTTTGKYTVSLTATNAGGSNTKTRVQYINVRPSPTPTPTCSPRPTGTCTPKPTPTCTPKPIPTCTIKPTLTCTIKPTTTATREPCIPYTAPVLNGTGVNGRIRLEWDVITNPCLQGYKVVISKNNPNPKYPDDGYMYWITDRNIHTAVVSSTGHYTGGDFGGYLQPGQKYYFSITAVYPDAKVAGNVLQLEYPV